MTFAHDTEVALAGAAALVNTAEGRDGLPDVAALDRFVTEWGWTGELRHDDLFRLLDREGYTGWVGCEYRPEAGTLEGLGWFAPWRKPL